ncbi:MAG: DUF4397 domain-containing protein [Burkholderiales bacterium]
MKKLKLWGVVGLVVTGMALSGCGSDDSSSTATLRVLNATNSHASIDLLVNANVAESATATDAVSAYASVSSGSNTLQVNDTATSTALVTVAPTLTGGNNYTLIAYEAGSSVKTLVLTESNATPTSGTAQMRLVNAATSAGTLDTYVASVADCSSSTLSTLTPLATLNTLATYGPGTYRVCVTAAGDAADLRMDMSVTLANQQIAYLIMTPAAGGSLINGSLLTQQGSNVATRNTGARVRLASAVSGGASVAATATLSGATTTSVGDSIAPALGYYVLVPNAASRALNITVGGLGSVSAPSAVLAAGGDYTLLVYGSTSSATASLLTDDNRPPTDGTSVKLRLINGITGSSGNLTLTANNSLVAGGVVPGSASSYITKTISTTAATDLLLTSSAVAGNLLQTSTQLNVNTVYTVLAGGDVSAPQFIIR